jgi:RNA polymerase primary sigma factor
LPFLPQLDFHFAEEPIGCEEFAESTRLAADDEARIFRQMNLAFYRAAELRTSLDRRAPDELELAEVERLILRGEELRNGLAIVFKKLSDSIARVFVSGQLPFDELASEGLVTLLHAITKFDPDRGFRFSTYATHAVRRRLTRYVTRSHATRELSVDWQTAGAPESRGWSYEYERNVIHSIRKVEIFLSRLSVRERYIIRSRFGWGRDFDPRTLQDLADEFGVSRERIRQLEAQALTKLRRGVRNAECGMSPTWSQKGRQ